MVIPIDVKADNFYRYYVELINPIIKLRKRELDVLAKLMYYNNEYKDLEESIRFKIVFDYDTKLKIREELNIKDYALQNLMTSLRKKGAIKNKRINPSFVPVLTEDVSNYKIIFNININDK